MSPVHTPMVSFEHMQSDILFSAPSSHLGSSSHHAYQGMHHSSSHQMIPLDLPVHSVGGMLSPDRSRRPLSMSPPTPPGTRGFQSPARNYITNSELMGGPSSPMVGKMPEGTGFMNNLFSPVSDRLMRSPSSMNMFSPSNFMKSPFGGSSFPRSATSSSRKLRKTPTPKKSQKKLSFDGQVSHSSSLMPPDSASVGFTPAKPPVSSSFTEDLNNVGESSPKHGGMRVSSSDSHLQVPSMHHMSASLTSTSLALPPSDSLSIGISTPKRSNRPRGDGLHENRFFQSPVALRYHHDGAINSRPASDDYMEPLHSGDTPLSPSKMQVPFMSPPRHNQENKKSSLLSNGILERSSPMKRQHVPLLHHLPSSPFRSFFNNADEHI